jgi:phosphatidylglycerophosphatase GEP4
LRAAGFKAICFDKDNTLTLPYQTTLHPPLKESLEECKRHFEQIAVLSNSAGSPDDVDHLHARQLEESLGLQVIRHRWKKPMCSAEIVKALGTNALQIVMVGDRLATDVWMANEAGMLSIHTKLLSSKDDNPNAIKMRQLENWILERLERPYTRPDLQSRFIKSKI